MWIHLFALIFSMIGINGIPNTTYFYISRLYLLKNIYLIDGAINHRWVFYTNGSLNYYKIDCDGLESPGNRIMLYTFVGSTYNTRSYLHFWSGDTLHNFIFSTMMNIKVFLARKDISKQLTCNIQIVDKSGKAKLSLCG